MKQVTHVITTIERGGAEKQLLTLAKLQSRTGRRVTVIPLKGKLELKHEFEKCGVTVDTNFLGKRILPQIILLSRFFRATDTIIHAHLPRAEILSAIARSSRPMIFSRHNAEPFFPGAPKWLSCLLSRFVALRSSKGIAISQAVSDYLFLTGEIGGKFDLAVIHYGRDQELSYESKQIDFELGSGPILGTIGRLVPQKDYETILTAFKLTLIDFPTAHLIVLGEGYLLSSLQAFAEHLGVASHVHFVGKKENVSDYLHSFDLFILASKYEGFGLVLLEAMSCMVPIVASNNSAIPEVLGPGHPGLATTSNAHDFQSKVAFLLSSEGRDKALQAQSQALREFSPDLMLSRMDLVYSNI
jgi:glycosyltransferase involved in cell wall biosynthesis